MNKNLSSGGGSKEAEVMEANPKIVATNQVVTIVTAKIGQK